MIFKEYQNIPEDWEMVKMSDIASINPRKMKKIEVNGKEREIQPKDRVTFLAMDDVSESSEISTPQIKNYEDVSKGYTSFKEDDILVAKITPCFENGKGALAQNLKNGIGFGSTEFHVLRPKKFINKKWLHYLTNTYLFRKRGELNMQGSAGQQRVPTNFITTYKLPKPPKIEQDGIVSTLCIWDKAISTLKELIQAKKRYKKGLMQQLLSGKKRFPEFEGEPWEKVKLSDLTTGPRIKGKSVEQNNENRGVPYIGSTSFDGNFEEYTNDPDAVIAEKKDLLLLWDGEYAGKVTTNLEGAASSTVAVIRLDSDKINNHFLKLLMEFDNAQIRAITEGSGIPHIPKDFVSWYTINLPPKKEQDQIVNLIGSIESEISLLVDKIDLLRKQKKGLMQKLLTGKIRVS